ncbi:sugar-binding transcriptional regulator [Corynebacterium hesseae]|uniref:Sugar-binding transcriptional regulator n=1 Tax=Corynebacterium hesseae TaxID=2913502 RepID=A0ABU9UK47_9CORY|nr:sugar-binding transcriptional regulator [Corynebacterium aurimucosum]
MMEARDFQAIDAAKLYYLSDKSQSEVAKELGVSRPTVSKLLATAREKGFVRITIVDPRESGSTVGAQLKEAFGLSAVQVAPGPSGISGEEVDSLGRLGAQVLQGLVKDGDSVGVSWGNTMYAIARHLEVQNVHGVEIVQLKGGMSHSERATNDFETIDLFCRAFHAHARLLPLPAVFRSAEVKRLVEDEPHIAGVMERGRLADVVVFTVGAARPESMLFQLGYFSDADRKRILSTAVGDICSRWVDRSGRVCVPDVDARTVGIGLQDLKLRPVRLLVAGGLDKAEAILVALREGYVTHLVIDQGTAEKVLLLARM